MTSDPTWRDVEEAFHDAADLIDVDERRSFLDRLAHERPEVARQVERLLAADEDDVDYLDPARFPHDLSAATSLLLAPGTHLGRFEIIDEIGRGGMGVVYRAKQQDPHRTVAVKVLRRVIDESAHTRFRLEAQILARLRHPNIARVLEAGIAHGVPWFAMEFVAGCDLATFAANLDLRSKLEVFDVICDAVHHAHLRGVVHRDLKPSNILVDDAGKPVLLDFGIARVTDGDRPTSFDDTAAGSVLGTIAYMSPEQALGRTDEIDARSDIYSLGVVLHEIVCSRSPFDVLPNEIPAAVRIVAERPLPPMKLDRRDADLETVVRMATSKEPKFRYASVAEFAEDVRRFVDHRPVNARPPTTIYLLGRLVRRHRVAALFAALALIAIIGGLIASLMLLTRAEKSAREAGRREKAEARARAEAIEEADRAREIAMILRYVLSAAHPGLGLGRDVRLRDVLGGWSRYVRDAADLRPSTRVNAMTLLGSVMERLGRFDESRGILEHAHEIAQRHLAADDVDAVRTRLHLGQTYEALGELHRALAATNPLPGNDDDTAAAFLLLRARILTTLDRLDEAEATGRCAAQTATAPQAALEIASTLAATLTARGRTDEARQVVDDALAAVMPEFGRRHPSVLALRAQRLGLRSEPPGDELASDDDSAEKIQQDAENALGFDHRQTILIRLQIVRLLMERGELDDALTRARRLVRACKEIWTRPTATTIRVRLRLGTVHYRRAEYAEARREFEQVIDEVADVLPIGHRLEIRATEYAVRSLLALGELDGADRVSADALSMAKDFALTLELVGLVRARSLVLGRRNKLTEAENLLAGIDVRLDDVPGFDRLERSRLRNDLAAVFHRQERFAEAEAMLRQVVTTRMARLGPRHRSTGTAKANLATILYRRAAHTGVKQDYADVERLLRETMEGALATPVDPPARAGRRFLLGLTLEKLGRSEDAITEIADAIDAAETDLPADHSVLRRLRALYTRLTSR